MEAEDSNDSGEETVFVPTKADEEFIDDSLIEDTDNTIEIQKEHERNVRRIAKNLIEFSDSLDFKYTDMNSLKSFIIQML